MRNSLSNVLMCSATLQVKVIQERHMGKGLWEGNISTQENGFLEGDRRPGVI